MVQQLTAPPPTETAPVPTLTYEEFRAAYPDDIRAELVDGEVILLMPPSRRHQTVSYFLTTLLGLYVAAKSLGEAFAAPFEMRIRDGKSYREPDIIFVSNAHLSRFEDTRLNDAADLVIEIISDESVARDRRDKLADYAAGGVQEYWIVDPRPGKEEIRAWTLSEEEYYVPMKADELGRLNSTVVPGFWLTLAWLTTESLPYPLNALAEIAPDVFRAIEIAPPA